MSFQGIRSHDLVKFRLPSGKVATGRAQGNGLFPTHIVVSLLAHRLPGVPIPHALVNESNYVSHKGCNFYGNLNKHTGGPK